MTSRTVAYLEWGLAAGILLWNFALWLTTLPEDPVSWTLGIVVTTVPIGLGLVISLAINGGVHFRRRPLGKAEAAFLVIEGVIVLLLIAAVVADQSLYTGASYDFGHWLDWFMPLWLLLVPIAIVVGILAIVRRAALPQRVVAPAPQQPAPPVA